MKLTYIPMQDNPLSSDIFLFQSADKLYLYDVGNGEINLNHINSYLNGRKANVIISHFHLDHIGNFNQDFCSSLYISKQTSKYISSSSMIIVDKVTNLDDITIIPIPSTHAKGCLGIVVEDTFYVGDSLYPGKGRINVQFLKMQIDLISSLDICFIWQSHKGFKQTKEEVLTDLKQLYSKREKNNPYIEI